MKSWLNTDLLRKTLQHIEKHPEQWNQVQWVAGSPLKPTMCFAARAYTIGTRETLTSVGGLIVGNSRPIAQTAARLLGFTEQQVLRVFFYVRRPSTLNRALWSHITFADLCARIEQMTGYRYEPDDAGASA